MPGSEGSFSSLREPHHISHQPRLAPDRRYVSFSASASLSGFSGSRRLLLIAHRARAERPSRALWLQVPPPPLLSGREASVTIIAGFSTHVVTTRQSASLAIS